MPCFEQGPIRPPSEAASLLVRVSRNCPWNRCAFCPVYKGEKFSLRAAADVLADLDAMRDTFGDGPKTVFLQDANPLLTKPDELIQIVEGVRQRFPNVKRITAYARSHTLARRTVTELSRIRQAGLDRLHVGMESGCDDVLRMMSKGTTRAEQIEGGQRAKQAGFELSEYIMPGLGGKALSDAHADDSASALVAIRPDFIRLRTTAASPGTELFEMKERGDWIMLSETEGVAEIRRFLTGLSNLSCRIESDHILNLLMELHGQLPQDLDGLISLCDQVLQMPEANRDRFILARRLGWIYTLEQLEDPALQQELDRALEQVKATGVPPDRLFSELRARTL